MHGYLPLLSAGQSVGPEESGDSHAPRVRTDHSPLWPLWATTVGFWALRATLLVPCGIELLLPELGKKGVLLPHTHRQVLGREVR